MSKLNLGAGRDYKEGYVNADISPEVGADVVFDLQEGLPFDDNYFDEVLVNNVLCQILLPQNFIAVMNELWRITNGFIQVRVPNAEDICAWQDPMDCRRFTDQSFTYLEGGHRRYEQYGKHYGFKPFKVELIEKGAQLTYKLWPIK